VRTWSRRGQTPILQYNFNWDTLSATAGITFYNFYSRLYKGSVKSAQVVDFLQALLRHIPGLLLIIWDRLSCPPQQDNPRLHRRPRRAPTAVMRRRAGTDLCGGRSAISDGRPYRYNAL
jgi:hypothetical protein